MGTQAPRVRNQLIRFFLLHLGRLGMLELCILYAGIVGWCANHHHFSADNHVHHHLLQHMPGNQDDAQKVYT
ncbi:hypothetical protein DM860_014791 [Cuscuta australis]|uniref:Uncharacterized protein n=1 Tax=Cuscuta australis TaxID=267555 RepID=A0A328CZQ3_9ASTE|nr:hypothetical protein DM860_014791 [Cuscuta australis]